MYCFTSENLSQPNLFFLLDKLFRRDNMITYLISVFYVVIFFSRRQQVVHQNGPDPSAHLLTSTHCARHIFNSGKRFITFSHFEHKKARESSVFDLLTTYNHPKTCYCVCIVCLLKSCKH